MTTERRPSRARLVVPAALTVTLVVAAASAVPGCGGDDAPPIDAAVDAPIDAPIDAPDAPPPFD